MLLSLPQYHKTVRLSGGENLLEVLRSQGLAPESPCGGQGTCGKCTVTVNGQPAAACRTTVEQDLTVLLPVQGKAEILTQGLVLEIQPNPWRPGPALAFDLGTTTMVCFLLDGQTGQELASASMLNPQAPYGADVVTRIQAALNGHLEAQQQAILTGMIQLTSEVCAQAGCTAADIGAVSVVGNPCMQQLFLGLSPENLAKIPFAPRLTRGEISPAAKLLPDCENALLLTVPDVSGYVGADSVGCILATGLDQAEHVTLLVDIGTNGEMVLGNTRRMAACSTAAGPALEGARIRFGMRGAAGAIDHVTWRDGALYSHVIGEGPAQGICGSGLIDAVAVALEQGLINQRGRIQCPEEAEGQRILRLTDRVWLTQDDVREVMLAKGAIAAGIRLMADHLGLTLDQIDRVLLAGAFGSFMDPASACRIGLLPPQLLDRVQAVGNAAGSGAKLLALDRSQLDRAQALTRRIEFIELGSLPEFQRTFARCMML